MSGVRLTDKGRSAIQRIKALESDLASIWREPFETYEAHKRLNWMARRDAATNAFQSAMEDLFGDKVSIQ
jgi:hypothetical protein